MKSNKLFLSKISKTVFDILMGLAFILVIVFSKSYGISENVLKSINCILGFAWILFSSSEISNLIESSSKELLQGTKGPTI